MLFRGRGAGGERWYAVLCTLGRFVLGLVAGVREADSERRCGYGCAQCDAGDVILQTWDGRLMKHSVSSMLGRGRMEERVARGSVPC